MFDPFENDETMKVEVNLYANLARYLPASAKDAGGIIDIDEGITVGELINLLCVPGDQVKLVFVDGVHAGMETVLKNGSRLGVFPPVGGG